MILCGAGCARMERPDWYKAVEKATDLLVEATEDPMMWEDMGEQWQEQYKRACETLIDMQAVYKKWQVK